MLCFRFTEPSGPVTKGILSPFENFSFVQMRRLILLPLLLLLLSLQHWHLDAQIRSFPYTENFDSVTAPTLPPGWSSSFNRSAGGDFTTTTTSPHSPPNAVISTNSVLSQILVTPRFDFTNRVPDRLEYWTSRSATHTSGVIVEASTDNGTTYSFVLSDTLRNPGTTSYNFISVNLPAGLSNQSQVRFRWRIIGGTGGTAGTFRIDDLILSVKANTDLAVRSVSMTPAFPLISDSVTFTIVLANLGVQTPASYALELFDDVNRDSVGQTGERFRQLSPQPISPGDSLTLRVQWNAFSAGDHQILVVVSTTRDENAANNRGVLNFFAGLTPRSVVINEIMYGPSGGEPEWIEIHNTTPSSINLKNWKISNRIVSTRYSFTTSDIFLPSKGFAVITRDSLAFQAFHPSIPGLLFVNSSLPIALFRNDSDAVVLYDSRNLSIDSLYYKSNWGGGSGKSLERIVPLDPSTVQSNWGTSLDPSGSSPGRVNTLTQKENDLAIKNATVSPPFPNAGGEVMVTAKVANVGTNPASNYSVSFFEDVSSDSIGQESELITRVTSIPTLQPGDSASFTGRVLNVSLGDHRYLVIVDYTSDEDLLNNKRVVLVTVGLPQRTVVINEIMYGPSGGEPEWVEIYNTSNNDVNLRNWKISNRITSTKYPFTNSDALLPPRSFAVITRDSLAFQTFHPSISGMLFINASLPIALFSNSGDAVVVYDARNAPIDSLFYSPTWGGGGGRSLERVAPDGPSSERSNWGTSLDPSGSSPGRVNTIAQKDNDLAVSSILVSPLFPSAGANIILTAKIVNLGTNPASSYAVSFFDDLDGDSTGQTNELITRTSSTGTLQPTDSASFSTQVLNISAGEHRYIFLVESAVDEFLLNNKRIIAVAVGLPAGSVVINEIMYGPTGGEPEWIEIYNASTTDVNLKNWRLSNRTPTTKYLISSADISFKSRSYVVVTRDASILNFHASVPSMLVFVPSLPTALFSNSGDAAMLYDANGATMDSLTYTPGWGGSNGRSLERMDVGVSSTDSTNWGTSTDTEGSTPGRLNSVGTLDNDLKALRIFPRTPTLLQPGSPVQIAATTQNIGRQPASGYSVKFYHDVNRDSVLTPTELIGTVTPSVMLQRRDSVLAELAWQNAPSGPNRVAAVVEFSSDQRTSNNSVAADINVGFRPRALIINEIMYGPLSEQAEWVELYNPGSSPVDLSNWTLSDMRDATGKANVFSIAKTRAQVPPGGFAVISSDSSIISLFPSLRTPPSNVSVIILNRSSLSFNNEGDDVIITDLIGTAVDSVRYSPSWHNPDLADVTGVSLERINPNLSSNDRRNWSSCVERVGGTPGRQNSIFTTMLPSQVTLTISPNPFSPDGDGFEDFAIVGYQLTSQIAQIRIKIFDSLGRLVRTLANNEPSGSRAQIIWDGLDDEKQRLRMGIYVIFLEAINSSGGVVESAKAAAVVAGRL